jgi:hypothetical protein
MLMWIRRFAPTSGGTLGTQSINQVLLQPSLERVHVNHFQFGSDLEEFTHVARF